LPINRNSLKQVLTNLVKNAVEALQAGGEIEIATRDQVNVDGRPYVEVRIADNGPGIPDEVISSIFTPVKSRKGREHAGLGLTIVKNLMTDLHGSISCRNIADGGAEFVILLPRRPKQ
jgi:signal transduction histidine kinase